MTTPEPDSATRHVSDSHVTRLADGRDLGWIEMGDPDGWPMFGFHGTPGSRHQVCLDEGHPRSARVRLVAPDRPGYGLSTFAPHRTLAQWPRDVAQLADHLGIDRFSVLGISGGGPHALACAALMPDRVVTAGVVSGAGPLSHAGIAEGLPRGTRAVVALARNKVVPFHLFTSAELALARRLPRPVMDLFVRQLPAPDAAILTRPDMAAFFAAEIAQSSRTAGRAMAQDLALFASDWGFDLAAISVPVTMWQGDLDKAVPIEHARLMHAQIPGSVLHELPGHGHLYVVDRLEEILRELVPATPSGSA